MYTERTDYSDSFHWRTYKELQEPADIKVTWVNDMHPANVEYLKTPYAAYGNEPSLEHTYSSMCLIVEVDKADQRKLAVEDVPTSEYA